jgi:hypothetical protein
VHIGLEPWYPNHRRTGPGKLLLGRLRLVAEHPPPALPAVRRRVDQLLPPHRVGRREPGPDVLDDRRVQVHAADVVDPLVRDNPPPAVGLTLDHAHVERAAAEVVNHQCGPRRYRPAERSGEVRRRRERLGNQRHFADAGPLRRVDQDAPARRCPAGRVGEHRVRRWFPGHPYGLVIDAAQHRCDQLGHRILVRTQQDRPVVDPALDVGLVPAGVQPSSALGVPPGEQPPARLGVHRRQQQRAGREQQRLHPSVRTGERRHRVGRTEVDAQTEAGRPVHALRMYASLATDPDRGLLHG